ncbi:MAG: Peroxisome membrane anchor N-terminal [Lasallia pustulata]|uniref:Peroxisomal membrane protein PEX14 n=1 Tax=Lasallia pustulata TaxID=136370 RepID=A0A5M8Q1J2_9LECA|nr:MAG: Peroxisome membrane anchor N-terminal [Lasallia pustulata]
MVREDLISSAVNFLQDPSVAASPLDKRIAFLQSKNLTQEEVDLALARVGEDPNTIPPSNQNQSSYGYTNQQVIRQPPSPGYGYGYGPYQTGPWGQPPPLEPPRRDWRDWFIMATVTTGVGYGLYAVAKRYVLPLISPPTPPQLEQDKASIDASFTRAFELIDQLSADTKVLKVTETERTERLDTALRDVEDVISVLKTASRRQEDESRRIADEVRGLKDLIPKAMEGQKETTDGRLKELGGELRSLKMLMGNRVGGGSGSSVGPSPSGVQSPIGRPFPALGDRPNGSGSITSREPSSSSIVPQAANGMSDSKSDELSASSAAAAPVPGVTAPKWESSNSRVFDSRPSSRAAIPAWQMAAASKNKTEAGASSTANGTESSAGSEAGAGA